MASRQQHEAYSRPYPKALQPWKARQEAGRRKRPLKQAPDTIRDEGLGTDEGEQAKNDALAPRR